MSVLGTVVLVIISVLAGFFIHAVIFYAKQEVKEGKPAPSFYVESLDGKRWGQKEWSRPPRPILLIFISPGCSVCRRLVRFIDDLTQEYPTADLDIILVGINGDRNSFSQLKKQLNTNLNLAIDVDGVSKAHYGFYSLPMVFYISGGGIIKKKIRGFRPGDDTKYRALFRKRVKKTKTH
ncbi:MAG: TlpA family protein disulfide reductase [Fidelibacterota bacterium]